jgi:hypothetical protein
MSTGIDKIHDPFLKTWLSNYDYPLDAIYDQLEFDEDMSEHNKLAQMNVLRQIQHIKGYPIVAEKLAKGSLQIHGWYFDIGKGDVYGYEQDFKRFVLIDETEAKRICDRLQSYRSNYCSKRAILISHSMIYNDRKDSAQDNARHDRKVK